MTAEGVNRPPALPSMLVMPPGYQQLVADIEIAGFGGDVFALVFLSWLGGVQ